MSGLNEIDLSRMNSMAEIITVEKPKTKMVNHSLKCASKYPTKGNAITMGTVRTRSFTLITFALLSLGTSF